MTKSLFRYALLALFCLFFHKIIGQNEIPARYTALVQSADSLLQTKMYLPAAHTYALAFNSFQGKGFIPDRYQAAKAWAMAKVIDSAFVQLEKIVYRGKFDDYFLTAVSSGTHRGSAFSSWKALSACIGK